MFRDRRCNARRDKTSLTLLIRDPLQRDRNIEDLLQLSCVGICAAPPMRWRN
jgi:hypothetical protein